MAASFIANRFVAPWKKASRRALCEQDDEISQDKLLSWLRKRTQQLQYEEDLGGACQQFTASQRVDCLAAVQGPSLVSNAYSGRSSSKPLPQTQPLPEQPRQSSKSSLPGNSAVVAPAGGPSNDAVRLRNGGRFTVPRHRPPRVLRSCQSEPLMGRTAWAEVELQDLEGYGTITSPCLQSQTVKTPRTLRGVVRKHSKVSISLPLRGICSQQAMLSPEPRGRHRSRSPKTESGGSRSTSPAPSKSGRRVAFADDLQDKSCSSTGPTEYFSERTEADRIKQGRITSRKIMGVLYDLRRVGKSEDSLSPRPFEEPVLEVAASLEQTADKDLTQEEEEEEQRKQKKQEALMMATLKSCKDREDELREWEDMLLRAHQPLHELHGTRHATAVVSARTLAVITRKACLLRDIQARLADFELAHARKEEHLEEVVEGANVDERLVGIKTFLAEYVHKNGGRPWEADKSVFQIFATTFGLPKNHELVVRLKDLLLEAITWWSDSAVEVASRENIGSTVLTRLLQTIRLMAGSDNHPACTKLGAILASRLAENCLVTCKKFMAADAAAVERSTRPQPESARTNADLIAMEIKRAVDNGAAPKHPAMKECKHLESLLLKAEKDRVSMQVLLYAQELDEKDLAQAAELEVPVVGPASKAADSIEEEYFRKLAVFQLDEGHECMLQAKAICKAMRDRDGDRKRLANRAKRLAEKEQKEATQAAARDSASKEDVSSAWPALKKAFVKKYGSIFAAWRAILDTRLTGRCAFTIFIQAARDLSATGNYKAIFQELDDDDSGAISLKEADADSWEKVSTFHHLLRDKFGSDEAAWQAMDSNRSNSIDELEFKEECDKLGYQGNAHYIYQQHLATPANRSISQEDLQAIAKLVRATDNDADRRAKQ
eukprot:TRINITY_DN2744_c0_g1_i1.p1 TRINITY_DN2744_c0_g1~~TRINITY_DN2744_c0_g1_i1.p1  ORF type:complete len:890 (-),score=188.38 TRINITY_DN2744_c0_g1_i1:56-2725(-)